ncbi:site-specific integrase [Burkholderia ubonensis]|uniref:site-specific integrase n=1 Tax=Burkholderia ubonensis TaxID=101571 RepID=UPI00076D9F40|nr:site-specific integrase [Burkholderia ubonensis]KVK98626.1 integrase [Burkholderia ubonensis]KVQ60305.1 integrase [Burkholderia ubonensis]
MGRDGRGVRAASKSTIQISFTFRGVECRERIRVVPTAANLRKAEHFRAEILGMIDRGTFHYAKVFPESKRAAQFAEFKGEVRTVAGYFEGWLARQRKHLKASTYDGYRKIVDYHLIPKFGKLMLNDLRRTHFRDWFDTLGCSNKRLANIQSVARKAFDDAVSEDPPLMEKNPLYGWTYRKAEGPKEEDDVDPFTPEEQAAIVAALPPQAANMIRFAFWTGLRTSELVALDWSDVDWMKGVVVVRRALTQTAEAAEDTKTKSSRREVKLLPPARAALEAQRAFTQLAGAEVFQDPRHGARWGGDSPIRIVWTQALKAAKVRYRKPYQTRHTYASMMLSAGEHPMWVARQMGHSNQNTTVRIYARWMPQADPDAGGKAVEKFAADMLRKQCDYEAKTAPNNPK